jgi:hypothetical protein
VSGQVLHLSRDEYDRLQRVNWSTLKVLAKSPAHYRHQLLAKNDDTDARKLGRAVHLAVFEPERFASECVLWEDGRRAGKKWEAFSARHGAREILTAREHECCLTLQRAVRTDAAAGKYLAGGKGEMTLLWRHGVSGMGGLAGFDLDCKGRVDFLADVGAIVDLKTTRDASPDGFAKECWKYRYHAQAAFYTDGHEAATGARLPYVIVAVETAAPHAVQVYRVPESVLEVGREEYRTLLERLHFCRTNAIWPAYFDGESELSLPKWAIDSPDEDVSGLDIDFPNQEQEQHDGL